MESAVYCLLWIDWWPICMNKSEWASWVQAVGSVVAILGAFWLGERQAAHAREIAERQFQEAREIAEKQVFEARRLEANRRQLDDRLKTEVALQLFGQALEICIGLLPVRTRNPPASVHDSLERARELEDTFRALPLFEMPGDGVAVGATLAPKMLRNLSQAAQPCIEYWVGNHYEHAVLPDDLLAEFNQAQQAATHHFQFSLALCQRQVADLQKAMPVDQ
jgi:hypothetical protein